MLSGANLVLTWLCVYFSHNSKFLCVKIYKCFNLSAQVSNLFLSLWHELLQVGINSIYEFIMLCFLTLHSAWSFSCKITINSYFSKIAIGGDFNNVVSGLGFKD